MKIIPYLMFLLILIFSEPFSPCFGFNESINTCNEDDSGSIDVVRVNAGFVGTEEKSVVISVRIQNAPNIVQSLGFELLYPSEYLVFKDYSTKSTLVENFTTFQIVPKQDENSTLVIGGFSPEYDLKNAILKGESGILVNIEFIVLECPRNTNDKITINQPKDHFSSWLASGACIHCGCSCDINGDIEVTPKDALCAFQNYMDICPTFCGNCDNICCDVNLDGTCTPADALNIFRSYLGIETTTCMNQDVITPAQ